MTLLQALIEYGKAKGLLEGEAIDAFTDFLPEAPDNCVAFIEYGGDPVSPFTDCVHRSVQVLIRATSAEESKSRALNLQSIFRSETETLRVDFSDTLWGQVYIRQTPFKIDQDESDRVLYCFNLGITTNIIE